MYTNNRDAYRQMFFNTWKKYLEKLPLEPLEAQLVQVMLLHPEYHSFLDHSHLYQTQDFSPEENPFMHMSLHLALEEQIHTDRPPGIRRIYNELKNKMDDEHKALHIMLACLAAAIWEAQQTGEAPSEEKYLEALRGKIA